jgi:hypothetical protein
MDELGVLVDVWAGVGGLDFVAVFVLFHLVVVAVFLSRLYF